MELGCCGQCDKRLQGHHELQTSDALGVAGVTLGSRFQVGIALLNKEVGLPHGKIQRVLQVLLGHQLSRSTSCRSMFRTAALGVAGFQEATQALAKAEVIHPDETGWGMNGHKGWLHVLACPNAVVYRVDSKRGHQVLREWVGIKYSGVLVHDGFKSYNNLYLATHQQCVFHIIKRAKEILEVAKGGSVNFPRKVLALFKQGLDAQKRYRKGLLTLSGLRWLGTCFTNQMWKWTYRHKLDEANECLAKFLFNHLEDLFVFLRLPDLVEATNNIAERALRFNITARKLSGCNRTDKGARAQEVLPTISQTCKKIGKDPIDFLAHLILKTNPITFYDITPPTPRLS